MVNDDGRIMIDFPVQTEDGDWISASAAQKLQDEGAKAERERMVTFIRRESDRIRNNPSYGLLYTLAYTLAGDPLIYLQAALAELADELEGKSDCPIHPEGHSNVDPV